MSDDLVDVLREDAIRYTDLMGGSVKDSLLFAANEIERLQNELNRLTRGDVSPIITTLADALTYIARLEKRIASYEVTDGEGGG